MSYDVGMQASLARAMLSNLENGDDTITMSNAQWQTHLAFYRLTVKQRDAAWREIERLRKKIEERPRE